MVKQQIWVQALLKVSKSNRKIWLTEQLSIITPPMWHGQSFLFFLKKTEQQKYFSSSLEKTKRDKTTKTQFWENKTMFVYLNKHQQKHSFYFFAWKQQNKITKQCLISLNKQNKQIHSFLSVLINNKYNKQIFHIPWKIKTKNNVIILCKNKTRKQFQNPLKKQNKKTMP